MDATLPQRFTELSLHSLKHASSQPFQPLQHGIQQFHALDDHPQDLQFILPPISLKPRREESTVAAVDTSNIKLGETSTGMLMAVRGASVWKQGRKYRYMRFGPFLFHLTEENKNDVYTALQRTYLGTFNDNDHHSHINLLQVPMRIASLLERWLQLMLSKTVSNGQILLDGSLNAGMPDSPMRAMKEVLAGARRKGSVVMAFSKMTSLRTNGYLITDVPFDHKPPFLLETAGLRPKPPIALLGDIFVARLTKGNYAFRLDIDREISSERKVEAVERLLGNDLVSQSYPETLRLAHILCTFTANEFIAMQHFVTQRCGLRIVTRPDMHRLLFGPFGRGESCS